MVTCRYLLPYKPIFFSGSVFIWYGSGSSILGWLPIRIQSQGFEKKEVFSSQKRTSSTSEHEISKKNSTFLGHFLSSWIRIRWPDWIRIQFASESATLVIFSSSYVVVAFAAGPALLAAVDRVRCELPDCAPGWDCCCAHPHGGLGPAPRQESAMMSQHFFPPIPLCCHDKSEEMLLRNE